MAGCPVCHADNPDGARFCASCGSPMAPLQAREVRKTITVLFADVTGSTALGEQLDPETMRSIMGRYFTMMKAVIEGHGGTVEKFIGDAVMAVFGIPQVHEDDALRAVRAAAEIRTELSRLNAELEASRGLTIRFRTGVNTGEVVAGDPASSQTLVTGDTVNTAARLEQAAPPGEILLGALTWSLVRDAVDVEPVEPVAAKGKAEAVSAYRVISVRPGEAGRRRRLGAQLVGRERELARLEQAFRQAVADGACGLFTLLGSAGVGKSRLVAEFVAGLAGEAMILRGRCLSYGEGITYWPVGEIVRSAAAIDELDTAEGARAKVRAMLEGERDANVLAARVSSAIGLSAEPAPQEEIFWAIRKLLEHLARERPLVVVVEDIHWAEPTLLDLLEHIVDWSRDAPFLLLCPARPELLDSRPAWGGGKLNATTILLEALPADATGRLIAALPGGSALPNGVVERIQAAAEGNPLYVEEFLAMLVDDGHLTESTDGAWAATADLAAVRVPASISALLAARLEQLDPAERAVAERASVVGRVFEAAAVNELADAALRPAVSASLLALVRKELVRPDRSELTAGDAFRFRHILIRDAAYAALPKAERAELHERFADWLERTAGERLAELEEIVGHHLEQAYRYRTELGETGPAVDALGVRAGERLAAAGRAAYERGDAQAAASLLEVAAERLDIATRAGREVRLALVDAVDEQGHLAEAAELAKLVAEASSAADDTRAEALARIMRLRSLGQTGSISLSAPAFGRELQTIRTLVDRQHDPSVVSRFWMLFGNHQWELSDFDQAADATVHGVAFAEKSGVSRVIEDARIQLAIESLSGPTPVAVALAQFDDLLSWPETSRLGRASVIERMAILRAMSEAFDEARQDIEQSESMYRELGARSLIGEVHLSASWVERLAGDLEGEVDLLNQSQVAGEDAGAEGLLGYVRARRALALARLGRPTDAYRDLELADLDDSSRAKIVCEFARGRLLLDNGDLEGALQASDRAEALTRRSKKFVNLRIEALIEIAAVTFGAGQLTRAVDSATAAEDLAAQKGNLALQRRARDDLVRFRHALD